VDHKRFMVEVIVKEPLRPEEADRLQKWIAAQVDMPVLMTVQTADHPSDFYGDGIAIKKPAFTIKVRAGFFSRLKPSGSWRGGSCRSR